MRGFGVLGMVHLVKAEFLQQHQILWDFLIQQEHQRHLLRCLRMEVQ